MNNEANQLSQPISKPQINRILETMLSNIMQVPPNLSILEIDEIDGELEAHSLYLSPNKCLIVEDKLKKDIYPAEFCKWIRYFESYKSDTNFYANERYHNGISFCHTFLDAYFPDEIETFTKLQDEVQTRNGQ